MSSRASYRSLPGLVPLILLFGVLLAGWYVAPESHSQAVAPGTIRNADALPALVSKLKTQQDLMVANQTKIEAQTAELKEELRLSKIYSSRGGGPAH